MHTHDYIQLGSREAEIRLLCEKAHLSVEDIAHSDHGRIIVTIKLLRMKPLKLNDILFRHMFALGTRLYGISHRHLYNEYFNQLVFTQLPEPHCAE